MEPLQSFTDAATAIALVPRRGPALPSPDGTYYIATEAQSDGKLLSQELTTNIWKVGTREPYFAIPSERKFDPDSVCWLSSRVMLWAEPGADRTAIYTLDVNLLSQVPYHVCDLPRDSSHVRIQTLERGHAIIGFVSSLGEDGAGSNPTQRRLGRGSGQLYTKLPVRWLSGYCDAEASQRRRRSLFYVEVKCAGDVDDREWGLSTPQARPKDVLEGTDLLLPPWVSDPFTLFATRPQAGQSPGGDALLGFLVSAVPGAVDAGRAWTHGLYCVSIPARSPAQSARPYTRVQPRGWTGMPESVSVSASGRYAAFFQWEKAEACFDHGTIFVVHLDDPLVINSITLTRHNLAAVSSSPITHAWSPRIVSIEWSKLKDNLLYATVDDSGSIEAWKLDFLPLCRGDQVDATGGELTAVATQLSRRGCVTSIVPFINVDGAESLMITRSDFDTVWAAEVIDAQADAPTTTRLDDLRLPSEPSLQAHHRTITYPVGEYSVQAFVHMPMQPPQAPSSGYPLIVLIHGGPNDAHRDSWSPNWNPRLWTSRGFVVITPNISGSVGFGLPFAQAIFRNWGGRPHSDIVAFLAWLARKNNTLSDNCVIDTSRMLCCGYSFGGYLVNWIAGHPDAAGAHLRFRALIVHGGVFSTKGLLGGDLPLAYADDFGGFPWENAAAKNSWDRWDPSRFTENWATPMLFTHGHKDFRVPLTESLAAFQVCQNKAIPSELLVFPDEAHSLSKLANRVQWQRKLVDWSMKWISDSN